MTGNAPDTALLQPGANAEENAAILLSALQADKSTPEAAARLEFLAANAAAALRAGGKADEWPDAVAMAYEVLNSGAAYKKLIELRNFTQEIERQNR